MDSNLHLRITCGAIYRYDGAFGRGKAGLARTLSNYDNERPTAGPRLSLSRALSSLVFGS